MINTAPLLGLWSELMHLIAASMGMIIGAAIGLPIKRRIIRRYRKRNITVHGKDSNNDVSNATERRFKPDVQAAYRPDES